jgi:hypothetical protein
MFWASPRPSSGAYNCTRSLWVYRWRAAAGALLVVVCQTCQGTVSATHKVKYFSVVELNGLSSQCSSFEYRLGWSHPSCHYILLQFHQSWQQCARTLITAHHFDFCLTSSTCFLLSRSTRIRLIKYGEMTEETNVFGVKIFLTL